MKKFLALALILCLVFALVPMTSAETGSVYWLNFKPESDEDLQKVAKLYTEKTGVPVNVVTAASGTYSQTLTAEMDKSTPRRQALLHRLLLRVLRHHRQRGPAGEGRPQAGRDQEL